jgi:Cys-rich repeat protein
MNASVSLAALLVIGFLAISPQPSHSLECGDLDGDCAVSVSDSLRVLRRAVGLNQPLLCECNCDSVCETSIPVQSLGSECFSHEACLEVDPSKPYCDAYVCSECSEDQHCGEGFSCDHALFRCMRNCVYE